MSTTGAGIGS
jgi:hypothetical protein